MTAPLDRETVTLLIPAPAAWIRTNDHRSWHPRAELTRVWRTAAAAHARHARIATFGTPVAIRGEIWKPTLRRFDVDGHMPSLKVCVDALRDVGVLRGDDFTHVPEMTVAYGGVGTARIVLTITPKEKP